MITACHDKKKTIYLFFSFQQRCEEKLWYKSTKWPKEKGQ
jgi:hypothetical protein